MDSYDRALAIAPDVLRFKPAVPTLWWGCCDWRRLWRRTTRSPLACPISPRAAESRAMPAAIGKWKEGFAEFEWRKRQSESARRFPARSRPEWLGKDDLFGKTLLVRAEQGLGDTLQFVRYSALAQARGARVIVAVQPELKRLLRNGLSGADAVIGLDEPEPQHDFQVAVMSFALAFGTEVENVPSRRPLHTARRKPE